MNVRNVATSSLAEGPALVTTLDEELRRALEESTDGILVADQQGHILFANRALEAMSGHALSELMHLCVEDLVPATQRRSHERKRREYHQTASPPRPMGAGLDIRLHRHDGSEFPADVALSPVRTSSGLGVTVAAIREKARPADGQALNSQVQRLERDLHERSLQTLFAISLNLQAVAAQVSDRALTDRLETAVDQVDDVVRDLRNYIFGLRPGILSTRSPGQDERERG
jgi:PAS domain S-box-containing protein